MFQPLQPREEHRKGWEQCWGLRGNVQNTGAHLGLSDSKAYTFSTNYPSTLRRIDKETSKKKKKKWNVIIGIRSICILLFAFQKNKKQ